MIQHEWVKKLKKETENTSSRLKFDEKVVLICILAICFARMKGGEVSKVSLSVHDGFDLFPIFSMNLTGHAVTVYRFTPSTMSQTRFAMR